MSLFPLRLFNLNTLFLSLSISPSPSTPFVLVPSVFQCLKLNFKVTCVQFTCSICQIYTINIHLLMFIYLPHVLDIIISSIFLGWVRNFPVVPCRVARRLDPCNAARGLMGWKLCIPTPFLSLFFLPPPCPPFRNRGVLLHRGVSLPRGVC